MKCPRRPEDPNGVFTISGTEDEWREDNTCSFCGSLSSEEFFRRVEAGESIGPTDKNYKAYVGPDHSKFYFMHLSEDEMKRFVELVNDKKMKIGIPGHFYVMPYFVTKRTVERKLDDG